MVHWWIIDMKMDLQSLLRRWFRKCEPHHHLSYKKLRNIYCCKIYLAKTDDLNKKIIENKGNIKGIIQSSLNCHWIEDENSFPECDSYIGLAIGLQISFQTK